MGYNRIKKMMIENNSEEKSGKGIIILGYLFSLLGGLIGIILGISLLLKKKGEEGEKYYIYRKEARYHGIVIIIIAIIFTMIWTYYGVNKSNEESLLRNQKQIEQILFASTDVPDNTQTLVPNDSSFSIEVPSAFVQRQSPDKNAILYCSISDTIEMFVYVDNNPPLDVFCPEFKFTDRCLFPIERMKNCRTTKLFDSIASIAYYEQRETNIQQGKNICYITSYQRLDDLRNYMISVVVYQNYTWNFEKMKEVASSIIVKK